jgi:uncharacterized protein YndB with AHSA1/START domain
MNDSTAATTAYVEPVVKTVRVNATPERAFEAFTAAMGRWWLPTHSISPTKSPIAEIVMEPRVGGRWYERGEDGNECDWGHVLVWEPPTRVVLAWQLTAQWKFDPAFVTEVEVRFDRQASGGTEITLEHRNLERFGDAAAHVRAAVGSPGGWPGLLDAYAKSFA